MSIGQEFEGEIHGRGHAFFIPMCTNRLPEVKVRFVRILKNMQFLRPQGHPFIKDVRLLLSLPLYVMPTFPGFHWAII